MATSGRGISKTHTPLPSHLFQKPWEARCARSGEAQKPRVPAQCRPRARVQPTSWTILWGSGPGRPGAVGTPPAPRSACGMPPPETTHHAEARCPAPPPRGTRSAPGTREVTRPALRRHLNPGEVWLLRTPAYSPPSLGEEKPEARQQAEPGDPLSWRGSPELEETPRSWAVQGEASGARRGRNGRPCLPLGPPSGGAVPAGSPFLLQPDKAPGSPASGRAGSSPGCPPSPWQQERAGGWAPWDRSLGSLWPWAEEEPRQAGRGVLVVPDPLPPYPLLQTF